MHDAPISIGEDLAGVLAPRSPVRCGLCHLPVVRSLTAPPALVLEGVLIPEAAIPVIPPAVLQVGDSVKAMAGGSSGQSTPLAGS
jgi:hypothetical protein